MIHHQKLLKMLLMMDLQEIMDLILLRLLSFMILSMINQQQYLKSV